MTDPDALPAWVRWRQRPFPDANLLLLPGRHPAMVDSGFVGHAQETLAEAAHGLGDVELVVNTHWHSDHVGGNQVLQARGAGIAASAPDHDALSRRDPGCCVAQYLDQPVPQYTVDRALHDGDLANLDPAVILPAHGPMPADTGAALRAAHRRTQRLVDDPDGAVWYGVRRVFAFALMIRGGIDLDSLHEYLLRRGWFVDAARLLRIGQDELATELLSSMTRGGAVVVADGRLRAAAPHTAVDQDTLSLPYPKDWV